MAHVKLFKDLFENQKLHEALSLDAKVLYAFLVDRTSLSRKNGKKWELPSGETYVIFKQEETMKLLKCGHDKASKVARELEENGLIKRLPQGLGKPHLIIVDTGLVD